MNNPNSLRDYEELIEDIRKNPTNSKEEQIKNIDKTIKKIKEIKETFFKSYLDGNLTYVEYKQKIHSFFKGENPEKIIAELHKRKHFKENDSQDSHDLKKLILNKNLKKRKTSIIIISLMVIALMVLSSSFFLNSNNSGITGFFATDVSSIDENSDLNTGFEDTNDLVITTDPQFTDTNYPEQIIENPDIFIEQNPEMDIEPSENVDNTQGFISNRDEIEIIENQTQEEIDNILAIQNSSNQTQSNQSIQQTNQSEENQDQLNDQEEINEQEQQINIDDEIEIIGNQTPKEIEEEDDDEEEGEETDEEEISIEDDIEELFNQTTNQTIYSNQSIDEINNQTQNFTNASLENLSDTNITISQINQTGITYSALAIKKEITHINLNSILGRSSTFLGVGTNNTAIVIVNDVLEIIPINDIENDIIKIKEYHNSTITEFLLNITFVDKERYLENLKIYDNNQSVIGNETAILNQSLDNKTNLSNQTKDSENLINYLAPITLIPYQGIEIDLINATNADDNNYGFLETKVTGISTSISNNILFISYDEPNKTQNFLETMKIYLIKEDTVDVFYLNITLRTTGVFKSKIPSIKTFNTTAYINALDYIESDSCNIECINDVFNVISPTRCNFIIENKRSVPINDYCYLESEFEGNYLRQYFEVALFVSDQNFFDTQIISDNETSNVFEEIKYTKELSQPIIFDEFREIVFNEEQNTLSFDTKVTPDYYQIVLLYDDYINEQNYQIIQIAQENDLSSNQFGITGAFIGATRIFSSLGDFLTGIIMSVIRFFEGGITGRITQDLEEGDLNELQNENLKDATNQQNNPAEEEKEQEVIDEEIIDSIQTNNLNTKDDNNQANINDDSTTTQSIENSDITTINETQEENENTTTNNLPQTNITDNENNTINQSIEDTQTTTPLQNDNNISNITQNEDIMDGEEQIKDNTSKEINTTTEIDQGFVIEDKTAEQNETQNQIVSNDSNDSIIQSPSLQPIDPNQTIESDQKDTQLNLTNITNQTNAEIEDIKTKLLKIIESLNIYSRYDSRTKKVTIYYTKISDFEELDTSKLKIGIKYFANKISYTINMTSLNEFVDQYVISIKNPYIFDFEGMQLTLSLNTTKRKFYSKGHFAKIMLNQDFEKSVLLNNINLQRGSDNIIIMDASSPTFEFERIDLGEITKINIFNYSNQTMDITFSNYDESKETTAIISCNYDNLIFDNNEMNSYKIDLELCLGSNLTITANKKESKGMYVRLLGYYTYIDLSSVILKVPENIYLRSDCDDCVVESLCNPITFCPQSNVGHKDWNFVTDLEFDISDAEDILLNSAIKSAQLCMYNIYAGNLDGDIISIGFTNNTQCSVINIQKEIKEILKKQTSKEIKITPLVIKSEKDTNLTKWICIDIKEVASEYILGGNQRFVTRIVGSDLASNKASFTCFDSGILPSEKCSEFGINGCKPYLNITYEYLD